MCRRAACRCLGRLCCVPASLLCLKPPTLPLLNLCLQCAHIMAMAVQRLHRGAQVGSHPGTTTVSFALPLLPPLPLLVQRCWAGSGRRTASPTVRHRRFPASRFCLRTPSSRPLACR